MTNMLERVSADDRATLAPHLSQRPVRLGEIARLLGISIKISSLRPGISGQISRDPSGYTIRVNRNEARQRQRFTIAHEIAHFLLHKDLIDRAPEGITDTVLYRSGAPQVVEYEANRLAAEIVVPENLVVKELEEDFGGEVSEASIDALASRYEVSTAMMEIRLTNLLEVSN